MTEKLPSVPESESTLPGPYRPVPPAAYADDWVDYGEAPAGSGGLSLGRVVMALRRYWWMVAVAFVLGGAGAYVVYGMVVPVYTARAALLVMTPSREQLTTGAVQAAALMEEASLLDLLRAPLVTEPVVLEERLYLQSPREAQAVFEGFQLDSLFVPGRYVLDIRGRGEGWSLATRDGVTLERGAIGDSVGAQRGFLWRLSEDVDTVGEIPFTVLPPREAADQLAGRLQASLNRQGNFITVTLDDQDPQRAARILNGIIRSFEETADSLKAAGLEQSLTDVEIQAEEVQESLRRAREELQQYQMQIITRPSDRGVPIGAGLQETRAPIVSRFEELGADKEAVDQDRERLSRILATIPDSGVPITQLELIPSAASSSELGTLLAELNTRRVERRQLAQFGTEDYPPLVRMDESIRVLEYEEIPRLLRGIVASLDRQSRDLQARRDSISAEMQAIPLRMTREDALRQEVSDQEALATEVGRRRELQRLIFRSSLEDFQILNDATVPFTPSGDQRLLLAGAVLLGFLGAGLAGAILMDRFDSRFRYPEDLARTAGVEVLGMIPRIRGKKTQGEVEEAFRDLRMRLM
ncbi:MAG TPA: Wzz/FepE/Etk N-terminal domain-containing protein, partial [Longimicrobiales bacterium]|nr:Wzz/FepE/Etk N-terminal domain-containing protein [Longimicrobiales bacterium]